MRALLPLLLTLALAPAAEARSFVVGARGFDDRPGVVKRIGNFKPPRDPTLAAAVRAFGDPTSMGGRGNTCKVRWRPLGVTILFATFGGGVACDRSEGRAQSALIKGDKRWRTRRGLRIGARLSRLKRLYPAAKRRGGSYALVRSFSPFTTNLQTTVLGARVRGGRVRALKLFIGAAGE